MDENTSFPAWEEPGKTGQAAADGTSLPADGGAFDRLSSRPSARSLDSVYHERPGAERTAPSSRQPEHPSAGRVAAARGRRPGLAARASAALNGLRARLSRKTNDKKRTAAPQNGTAAFPAARTGGASGLHGASGGRMASAAARAPGVRPARGTASGTAGFSASGAGGTGRMQGAAGGSGTARAHNAAYPSGTVRRGDAARAPQRGGPVVPLSAAARREAQRKRLRQQRIRFFSLAFVVILALSGVITWLIQLPASLKAKGDTAAQSTSGAAVSQAQSGAAGSTAAGGTAVQATGTMGPVQQQDAGTYTPATAAMVAQPANGRVDMSYFDDALFIGDSLTQGFEVYSSGIKNAHYAAYVGVGPKQLMGGTVTNIKGEAVKAIDEILAAAPKKVYILLGTNALSSLDDEALLKYYGDFLDYLAPQLPADTVYYIESIPPVTAEKAAGDASYARDRIVGLDEKLAEMAYARGWNFLDLYGVLADENGDLNPAYVEGSDGVHLNADGYSAWTEFLVTHTAYSAQSPYIAGSPYMTTG